MRRPGISTVLSSLLIAFSITSLVHGAAPTTGALTVLSDNQLTSRIVSLVHSVPLGDHAKIAVFVQNLTTREILVNIDSERPLKPASNFKLFTTAAGLEILGPDYSWKTEIASSSPIQDGVLQGDLLIVGYGDPVLGGRFHPDKDSHDLTWIFRDWAKKLRELGIEEIRGDIIGDDDWFDDVYFGRAWYPDERAEWYCAEVSSLSFNDNCIDILWRGASSPNASPSFTLNPQTQYCRINNLVKTVPKETKNWDIQYFRDEKSNGIRAEGKIPVDKEKWDYAAIYNPTLFTSTVIKSTFEKQGIKVKGQPRDIDDLTSKSVVRDGLQTLLTHQSPPLSKIVEVVNRSSQNLYSELLLRTLGKNDSGEGSFEAGGKALTRFLVEQGLHRNGFVAIDGSGLSYLNRCSARMLVDVLIYMNMSRNRQIFLDSLPRGGERGTLQTRFQSNERSKLAAPRIYGKTGYIGGVHTMSGYIQDHDNRWMAFSILLNDFDCPDDPARNLVDDIAVEIASSKYSDSE